MSDEDELILGRVNLNAMLKPNTPHPIIEILDSDGNADGDILVLKVLRRSK